MLALVLGVAMCLVACGGSGSTKPSPVTGDGGGPGAPNTVVIKNFTFVPSMLTVAPGTTVSIDNEDQAAHTVTANGKAFDTGNIAGGGQTTFTAPATAGSYPYLCTIHQYMTGTLVVK